MFRRMQMNVIEWKWHGMRSSTRNANAFNARTSHHVFQLQMKCTCDGIWIAHKILERGKFKSACFFINYFIYLAFEFGWHHYSSRPHTLDASMSMNLAQCFNSQFLFFQNWNQKANSNVRPFDINFVSDCYLKSCRPLSRPMSTCWIYLLLILCVWCEWEQCPVRELRSDFKKARGQKNSWSDTQTKQQTTNWWCLKKFNIATIIAQMAKRKYPIYFLNKNNIR